MINRSNRFKRCKRHFDLKKMCWVKRTGNLSNKILINMITKFVIINSICSEIARMKNTKRKQTSEVRYPEATYGIVDTSNLPNKMISNLHEIIQNLLNELNW